MGKPKWKRQQREKERAMMKLCEKCGLYHKKEYEGDCLDDPQRQVSYKPYRTGFKIEEVQK